MIADLATAAITHPFLSGFIFGGAGFGGSLGIIGWCLGRDAAMREVGAWMKRKTALVISDIPTLPPIRERRFIPTTPGRWS